MSKADWQRLKTTCDKCNQPHWYFFWNGYAPGLAPFPVTCFKCQNEADRLRNLKERNAAACQLCQGIFLLPDKLAAGEVAPVRCPTCAAMARTCRHCGKAFDSKEPQAFCSFECKHENEADEFMDQAPPIMRATDPANLPRPAAYRAVMDWAYGPRGLVIYGRPRTGKTRTIWRLLRDVVAEGFTARLIRGVDFQSQVITLSRTGGEDFEEWFYELVNVDVLAIDDLDKAKWTPRVESELYNLIDLRCGYEMPTIISTNSTGSELLARMSPQTGPAIVARITEFCDPINFDAV
jgi:hypothetical protein